LFGHFILFYFYLLKFLYFFVLNSFFCFNKKPKKPVFFGFSFVWLSHAKPKSQSGMRVEYLHNLSTRIVVVG
jgi:hypothetical protein